MYAQLDMLSMYYIVNMVEPSSMYDRRCLPLFVHPRLRHITHGVCKCESLLRCNALCFCLAFAIRICSGIMCCTTTG